MSTPQKIHEQLIKRGKTLAFAESCTGGHLAAKVTALADASKYFLGSLVTYSNEMKEKFLKVSAKTLVNHGAVSRETASEMLLGLMKSTGADYGIAITGIAGPSGGTVEKPVGTVYVATGEKGKKPRVIHCAFFGSRESIVQLACEQAFYELARLLTLL